MPTPADLVDRNNRQQEALDRFCYLQNQLHARPRVHITYRREAYEMASSNAVRVTFDRQVCSEIQPANRLSFDMKNPTPVFGDTVILELKFTDRFPRWFEELTQLFHLRQDSAAKYADGILQIGERRLMNAS